MKCQHAYQTLKLSEECTNYVYIESFKYWGTQGSFNCVFIFSHFYDPFYCIIHSFTQNY